MSKESDSIVATRVPGEMFRRIEERVREGSYASVSEYLRDLLRRDQERRRGEVVLRPDDESPDADLTHRSVVKAPDGSVSASIDEERRVA